MKIYNKIKYGMVVQTATLHHMPSGRWAFATSLFGEKPYEINMNMPIFDTENEATGWIDKQAEWKADEAIPA
ncbi:hypothetical protein SAMN02745823_03524 [Sporobacter termitidis DSM 10068]|uniref:Uncharacterized protein n=1 Tax=Sporobacter termitidis DSM 10068 TaxID=1123282 RepID=A0A1M5ZCM5_9FIRM|nr:hypothetical protein [Sporobacter termitidis]SHI21956.1 hypothetical protein SAMN02745823_03524 [Sporobacter termitidis DSM 10068]